MDSSEEKFFEIIDRFSGLIKAIIFKNLYQSRVDPEDIEQEVRFKLWRFLKKGKTIENLPSFIMKAVYTITMDELRKLRKQMPPGDAAELKHLYLLSETFGDGRTEDSPVDALEQRELGGQVLGAIETLSENRKQVLRLFVRGLSVDEISAFFGWDRIKVRHFLYRGIDDLRAKFAEGDRDDGKPAGDRRGPDPGKTMAKGGESRVSLDKN